MGRGSGLVQEPHEQDLGWRRGGNAAGEERDDTDRAMNGRAEERRDWWRHSI